MSTIIVMKGLGCDGYVTLVRNHFGSRILSIALGAKRKLPSSYGSGASLTLRRLARHVDECRRVRSDHAEDGRSVEDRSDGSSGCED